LACLQAISKGRCLEKLSIYHNSIGARGCQALTAAVAATPALKVTCGQLPCHCTLYLVLLFLLPDAGHQVE
jgi:hypothetical protein